MLDTFVVVLIVLMIGTILFSESKYLFSKPTCTRCNQKTDTVSNPTEAKKKLDKVVDKVKKETKKLKAMLVNADKQTKEVKILSMQKDSAPEPVQFINPVEHLEASKNIVTGANIMENMIDEDLPFSDYKGLPVVQKDIDGTIQGIRPPTYADPRVMNPTLAAAPVQFDDPAQFGTFGVTDDASPAFSTNLPKTDARIASDRSFEGFENDLDANGARLVMDGKVVKSACQLPTYQIRNSNHHTALPMRNLYDPPPKVEDLVDEALFDGLQGFPIDEKLDLLIPPGTALPSSEWAAIQYGLRND